MPLVTIMYAIIHVICVSPWVSMETVSIEACTKEATVRSKSVTDRWNLSGL